MTAWSAKDSDMWAFENPDIYQKLGQVEADCDRAMKLSEKQFTPKIPARDAAFLDTKLHPVKKGLTSPEGQARMLHDLASIELQAMELGLRSLVEFPEAPPAFREELHAVTLSEGQHLRLCLEGIEELGFKWGDWPIHCALWAAVDAEDSLLDRILIVHRYLEGSGLDAGSMIIKRLESAAAIKLQKIVRKINHDEIGHVNFGSQWYREICKSEKINPGEDFFSRMASLRERLPKRVEKVNRDLRLQAGFTLEEIAYYEKLREEFLIPLEVRLALKKTELDDTQS